MILSIGGIVLQIAEMILQIVGMILSIGGIVLQIAEMILQIVGMILSIDGIISQIAERECKINCEMILFTVGETKPVKG
jgi:hypothetical protein